MVKRKHATKAFKEKVQRDVEMVRRRAIATIELLNNMVKINWNRNSSLAIIAIIGQGSAFNCHFSEAVLDEVGIGWGRPFHQARVPFFLRKEGESSNIPYRTNVFKLSDEQYQKIAPVVFGLLQELTDRRVGTRKCNPSSPYYISCYRAFYRRKGRKLNEWLKETPHQNGCKFAVSIDSRFAEDVYWAELNINVRLRRFLEGLVKFSDLCLQCTWREWRGRQNFWDLKRPLRVKDILERKNLPLYLFAEMLGYLPGGIKNRFWQDIANIFGWDGQITLERKLSESVLSEPQSRVADIQIKVTTGLDKGLDHIVFEVFPSENWKNYKTQKSIEPEYEGGPGSDFDPAYDLPF